MTRGFSYAVIDAGVAYRENVDEVIAVLQELGEAMRQEPDWAARILEPLEVLGLDQLADPAVIVRVRFKRSEEHTSELQSLMRISYAVFCLKKKQEKDKKYTLMTRGNKTHHSEQIRR